MPKTAFWSRVGQWFRPDDRLNGHVDVHGQPVASVTAVAARRVEEGNGRRWWTKLLRTEEEPGLQGVSRHTAPRPANGRSAKYKTNGRYGGQELDELTGLVDRLTGSVGGLPQIARQQSVSLRSLTSRMESQADTISRLEHTLAQIPHIAGAHREAMVSVSRQIEMLRETTNRSASVLQGCQTTLDRIDNASENAVEAVKELQAQMVAREARTAGLLIEQSRRMNLLGAVGLLLAGTAAVTATLTLILR